MASPRKRNDRADTVYQAGNSFLGEPGEFVLNKNQINKLALFIRQLSRLYCVEVMTYKVTSFGYTLLCSAPAALPTRFELRKHFFARYGNRRPMPDFENHEIYRQWATRLRDFSCLLKDLEQRFTRWYNKSSGSGQRKGTVWRGRFRSIILSARKRFNQCISKLSSSLSPSLKNYRSLKTYHWDKLCDKFPLLEELIPTAKEVSRELSFFIIKLIFDSPRGGPCR